MYCSIHHCKTEKDSKTIKKVKRARKAKDIFDSRVIEGVKSYIVRKTKE
jgi:hypothetical protein